MPRLVPLLVLALAACGPIRAADGGPAQASGGPQTVLPASASPPAQASIVEQGETPVPPAGVTCEVLAERGLRLRSGPGTSFTVVGGLARSTRVEAIGRTADSAWLSVVDQTGARGWISADPQLVSCEGDLAALALADVPTAVPEVATQTSFVAGATPTAVPDPFAQQELPPGVEEQLSFVGGAFNFPCRVRLPRLSAEPAGAAVLEQIAVCVDGDGGEVEIVVTRPDGSELLSERVPLDPVLPEVLFRLLPGEPLGEYIVQAGRDGEVQTALLNVELAPSPRVVVRSSPVPAGESVVADLAGYAPESDVRVLLYRQSGSSPAVFAFVSELPQVRADQRGEGGLTIPTGAGDPPGVYMLETLPRARVVFRTGDAEFELVP